MSSTMARFPVRQIECLESRVLLSGAAAGIISAAPMSDSGSAQVVSPLTASPAALPAGLAPLPLPRKILATSGLSPKAPPGPCARSRCRTATTRRSPWEPSTFPPASLSLRTFPPRCRPTERTPSPSCWIRPRPASSEGTASVTTGAPSSLTLLFAAQGHGDGLANTHANADANPNAHAHADTTGTFGPSGFLDTARLSRRGREEGYGQSGRDVDEQHGCHLCRGGHVGHCRLDRQRWRLRSELAAQPPQQSPEAQEGPNQDPASEGTGADGNLPRVLFHRGHRRCLRPIEHRAASGLRYKSRNGKNLQKFP